MHLDLTRKLRIGIKSSSTSDAAIMPRSIQDLQKSVLELQKENRSQAVKIWQLEEDKVDLMRKLRSAESLSRNKEDGCVEAESNRRVTFGGVHFSKNTKEMEGCDNITRREEGGDNNDSAVEEIETLSTPEVEEGEGGLGISEKENGKGLMEKQMPSKSVEETPSIGGESELEKSTKSRRVLRGKAENSMK